VNSPPGRFCAVLILAMLALAMLHAAAPHSATEGSCPACSALAAPGTVEAATVVFAGTDPVPLLPPAPSTFPAGPALRLLLPERAPPSSSCL
jgi:hypothetical protein